MMKRKAIFIAATGQNVGKTTICLGLISGLKKTFPKLGFMKPVGQQHKKTSDGLLVDKDVILFKEYFHLPSSYEEMSPLIFPSGLTRDFLDGKIDSKALEKKIVSAYENLKTTSDYMIVEGTGHVGVGSLFDLNNAKIASLLDIEVVIIAKGGIGSSFDELALNKALLDKYQVKLRGVILNRVLEEKKEMVSHYMSKALNRLNLPLIGTLPYNKFLNTPAMEDFETLFNTTLLSGEEYHYCHFEMIRLVATSKERFMQVLSPNQLIVTPTTREDIVNALIDLQEKEPNHGIILTGYPPPSLDLIEKLKKSRIPCLYAAKSTFDAMRAITSFTAKISYEDTSKVKKAIELCEENINFSYLY